MNKKFRLFITIVFMLCILSPGYRSRGATENELRRKIEERQKEIKALEAEIATYQKSLENQVGVSRSLANEIKRLELEIKRITTEIKRTQAEISQTQLAITELEIDIDKTKDQIRENEESLAEVLRLLNESDGQSMIEVLFAQAKISDFFSQVSAYEQVGNGVTTTLDELLESKRELEDARIKEEKEQASLVAFRNDLGGQKTAQEELDVMKKNLLRTSKNQEAQYQKLLLEREKKRELIQREIQSIEDELRRLIDPSLLPEKGKGVLGWPVENPQITQRFGFTDFALTYGSDVYRGQGHNGVDFRAALGTRILSAEIGIIKDTGNTDTICPGGSYGKYVIIEHPNGLSTLYAHLSGINVARGQQVTRGQVIAYSGSTGYVTGPHLHFTVYASNTYRLHTSVHCGLIPAGGYLNPLDYL